MSLGRSPGRETHGPGVHMHVPDGVPSDCSSEGLGHDPWPSGRQYLQAYSLSGCLASCSLPSRLHTGVRGASGKPQGTAARAHVGQVLTSIHTKLRNKEQVTEAHTGFRFPGRQQVRVSKKWGFTKFNVDKFEDMVAEKRLIAVGCGVKYIPNRGPLDKWRALHS
ncbi:60S ribosomal protein L10-like [Canis lupus dingo]|uniref:60S ribosomal protein L10-like n=1 Tax=Canis lupus dingo TaxID=286419 RepID=UPI000DC66E36|nr:60S ribosomal protein L10-like [Canis lupus dingo]